MAINAYQALTKAPAAGAPLIFAFHGTGGDERQFYDLIEDIAPTAGIVSPRGDVSENGAARFFKRTGEGVYDMDDLAERTEKMAGFVEAYKEVYSTAAVYGFGYSNGANILASLTLKRADLFERVGLLHPLIPWEPAPNPGLVGREVLITAGENDPICPWPVSQRLIRYFEAQGSRVSTAVHSGGHGILEPELTELARLLTAPSGQPLA
ncbi:MAG: alpha/beta hydrolase [Pseudomonadota bacterium]